MYSLRPPKPYLLIISFFFSTQCLFLLFYCCSLGEANGRVGRGMDDGGACGIGGWFTRQQEKGWAMLSFQKKTL